MPKIFVLKKIKKKQDFNKIIYYNCDKMSYYTVNCIELIEKFC